MFFREIELRDLTRQFMPRLKESSIEAMIDVACHGHSILKAADKHSLTHQSLSKNLISLKKLQDKIAAAKSPLPRGYLFKENTAAFFMAEVSFSDATDLLVAMCEKLGGRVNMGIKDSEIKFYLEDSVTIIYLNPDDSYHGEWSYQHIEL